MALPAIDRHEVRKGGVEPTMLIGIRNTLPAACRRRFRNNGFTLIEMLVALFILTVSILGLTTLTITDIRVNHQNDLRNTAIKLTSEVAEILLAQPIANVVSGGLSPYNSTNPALMPNYTQFPNPVQQIKGGTQTYTVNWAATGLTANLTEIIITVGYTYRGQQRTNSAVIYKHRAI